MVPITLLTTLIIHSFLALPPEDPIGEEITQTTIEAPDQFNLVDVPCIELLDDFTEKSGWTFEGFIPPGQCTFDAGREAMPVRLAATRLSVALFEPTRGVFLFHGNRKNSIEIVRASDVCSLRLGLDWVFTSVDAFALSSREDSYLTLILQKLRHGCGASIAPHFELLPSYVRSGAYDRERDASVTLLAAAVDLRLYIPLIDMLDIALRDGDVRVIEIELAHAEPADLVAELHQRAGQVVEYRPIDSGRVTKPENVEVRLRVWGDWAHQRVVVAGSDTWVEQARAIANELDSKVGQRGPPADRDLNSNGELP